MSVDVGDAFELTFRTTTGAIVNVSWYDPFDVAVLNQVGVAENPAGSGSFPRVLVSTAPGVWRAVFTASGVATAVETFYERAVTQSGPPPLAVVSDVRSQFGPMSDVQTGLASTLLRAASKLVRSRYPYIDKQVSDGVLDGEIPVLAVVNMVLRVMRNPDGLRAQTTGPFSKTYDAGQAAGLLYIDDTETAMLVPTSTMPAPVGTIMARAGLAPSPWGVRPWMSPDPGRRRRGGW